MIKVEINYKSDETMIGFLSTGHAMAGEYGSDIVCAAVSAIMQTAVSGLSDVAGIRGAYEIDDGYLEYILPNDIKGRLYENAKLVIDVMTEGLKDIQRLYPDKLTIIKITI